MPLKDGSWLMPTPGKKVPWVWKVSSRFALATVGLCSKVWIERMNRVRVHNAEVLQDVLEKRPKDQGLLTVSNHTSCMDDPLMWGTLKTRQLVNIDSMRWTSAAEDIVFIHPVLNLFFSLGKVFPVVRGDGVYQKGMDFAIQQLNLGSWCHFFPEGKVNMTNEFMRLKWGVGRIIAECKRPPIVVPLWHIGMDEILPNRKPYIPQTRKRVTLVIGNPMDFTVDVEKLKLLKKTPMEMRKNITDKIQDELHYLKKTAETLHKEQSL